MNTVILIAAATAIATFIGGSFALRFRDKLHLILGFSAGAVIGVAFFDLLPESIELGINYYPISTGVLYTAIGFIIYLLIDRLFQPHGHHHEHTTESNRGNLRAGSMSIHSFLDGIGIGLSFQVSTALGIVVALAVLAHDFSDGINTVSAILKNGGEKKQAFKWLLVDTIAPIAGIAIAYMFPLPEKILAILLSLFAGLFIYIGASDLIPESFHGHPTKWTTLMTILGAACIFFIVKIAG